MHDDILQRYSVRSSFPLLKKFQYEIAKIVTISFLVSKETAVYVHSIS